MLNNLLRDTKKRQFPDIANEFMKYFDEKIKKFVAGYQGSNTVFQHRYLPDIPYRGLLCFREVTFEYLVVLMKKMKMTYCCNDPLPMSDVISDENFHNLLQVVLKIENLSISECTSPQSEKLAIIKPILKGNRNRQNFSFYRPVSNLSILSKVLENIILDQLLEYLVYINVLPDTQSSYRRLHSTEIVLCNVTNNLIDFMDAGKCGVLVVRLSAAFDTVMHEILLQDLKAIGVTQKALHYLESYLSDRNFSVQVGNALSEHCPLRREVSWIQYCSVSTLLNFPISYVNME